MGKFTDFIRECSEKSDTLFVDKYWTYRLLAEFKTEYLFAVATSAHKKDVRKWIVEGKMPFWAFDNLFRKYSTLYVFKDDYFKPFKTRSRKLKRLENKIARKEI